MNFLRSWKNGAQIKKIDLDQSLPVPNFVCFSPTNWRNVTVAYDYEINIWLLEQCESISKVAKTRFLLPRYDLVDNQIVDKVYIETLRVDENYPNTTIARIDERFEDVIDESLDKSLKQKFNTLCWNSSDEIYFSTDLNFIYKFSLAENQIVRLFRPFQYERSGSLDKISEHNDLFEIKAKTAISSMSLHREGLFIVSDVIEF